MERKTISWNLITIMKLKFHSSIANRFDGMLLFGVKNNGELEGAKFNDDDDGLKIINIAHNNCSPPVICSNKYSQL